MDSKTIAAEAKRDSFLLSALTEAQRNEALEAIARALTENKEAIFAANAKDLEEGKDLAGPILGRLKFDQHKLDDVTAGIYDITKLPDPIHRTLFRRQLAEDLVLEKVSCPIGVIGVIFESRPDALVQISALCLKSGNAVILKGGSEAKHTNRALFDVIHEAGVNAGLPERFASIVEDRAAITELLACDEDIDLIIPRGSNAFVRYIMDNSRIPVMGHADGICHVYVDKAADIEKAIPIIIDAKTQYVAACNAAETLLVHEDIKDALLPALKEAAKVIEHPITFIDAKSDEDFREYLDYMMTVKTVPDIDAAIAHINHFGSHHTDCIITEDDAAAERFMEYVDSAGVYRNCSTRFADGFRYGFGAEVGISTGKLHARGPVGLEGLSTYKYKLYGNGQIVADFAEGRKKFEFVELD